MQSCAYLAPESVGKAAAAMTAALARPSVFMDSDEVPAFAYPPKWKNFRKLRSKWARAFSLRTAADSCDADFTLAA
jgi:hypothetical protein